MFNVNLPAGGWLEFHGKGPNPELRAFSPDGSPFHIERKKGFESALLK
jgi:hypothetical protein